MTSSILAVVCTATSGYIVGDLGVTSLICGVLGSAVGLFGMHYWQVSQRLINNG
ncbi:MAG: hypothetical protein ACRY3E_04505 [Candidatus Lariskella arthropodorum]